MLSKELKKNMTMKDRKWFDKKMIKRIIKIGVPIILITAMFAMTDIIDSVSLGIWGNKNALVAAALSGRIYWIVFSIIMIIPSMFGFLIAQYFGSKEYDKEEDAIKGCLLFATIIAIIGLIIVYLFAPQILRVFIKKGPNSKKIIAMANKYLRIMAWLMLLEGIIAAFEAGIMAEGKTKAVSIIMVISIFFNFFFNWLLMSALDMGFIGCAISTVITWCIILVAIAIWIIYASRKGELKFGIRVLNIFSQNWTINKQAFSRIGLGLTTVASQASIIMTLTILSRNYGADGLAITSIIAPFFNLLLFASSGVVSTKSFFVTKELGAGNFRQAYTNDCRINLYAGIVAVFNLLLVLATCYFIPQIYLKQNSDTKLQATYCLIAIGISYVPIVIGNSFTSSLSAGGKGLEKFLATSIQPFILEVIVLYFIAKYTSSYLSFWEIYVIYRIFKVSKIVPSFIFWRMKNWITNVTGKINEEELMPLEIAPMDKALISIGAKNEEADLEH